MAVHSTDPQSREDKTVTEKLQFRAANLHSKHVVCKGKGNQANWVLPQEVNPHIHPFFFMQQDAVTVPPPLAVAPFKSVQGLLFGYKTRH